MKSKRDFSVKLAFLFQNGGNGNVRLINSSVLELKILLYESRRKKLNNENNEKVEQCFSKHRLFMHSWNDMRIFNSFPTSLCKLFAKISKHLESTSHHRTHTHTRAKVYNYTSSVSRFEFLYIFVFVFIRNSVYLFWSHLVSLGLKITVKVKILRNNIKLLASFPKNLRTLRWNTKSKVDTRDDIKRPKTSEINV